MNFGTFALLVSSVSLNALAQVVLRKAMTVAVLPPASQVLKLGLALIGNGWLWIGGVCYVVSVGIWLMVLSRVQVGAAYPMGSVGYIVATILGVLWLGESLSLLRIAGLVTICLGVFMISRTA
jgi:multidrug transporter EmrE-like cation transporter